MNNSSVGIIWDLENVTPPSGNNLFMEKLLDYSGSFGRVTLAKAYCDWTMPAFKYTGPLLARHHFYLVHVPREKKKKNSVDIQLVSDTLESLSFYKHIETYILITGDSDFRSLILALRRSGKRTVIVCDLNNAADSLLELADGFIDYRDLMVTESEEEDIYEIGDISLSQWMQVLHDIVQLMQNRGKPTYLGAVKVAMRKFHPQFDEKKLGFSRWSDFIEKAGRSGYVHVQSGQGDMPPTLIPSLDSKGQEDPLEDALDVLLEVLKELSLEDGGRDSFLHFSLINQKLKDRGIDLPSLGFARFKKFAQLAEFKGLIDIMVEGIHYKMRLKRD